ncbi:hypothetical protein Aglo03_26560 [Actinokineospora globicatena]|uniref:NlpC/P60 family protein n=1 Tax=Actinokineospora globicatena TaxID=103729 RepID=A0A9W6QNE8_9PSEU|nr:hypothetical protein Aglo03_26560 [Actinokineospora globicatena]
MRRGIVVVAVCGLVVAADAAGPDRVALGDFGVAAVARAEVWFRAGPSYDQDGCFDPVAGYSVTDWAGVLGGCHRPAYRTDCSGFVSMAWGLSVSYATPRDGAGRDLGDVTRVVERSALVAGDALVRAGEHVRLFERWVDRERSRYLAYDFGSTPVKHRVYVWGGPGELERESADQAGKGENGDSVARCLRTRSPRWGRPGGRGCRGWWPRSPGGAGWSRR